MGLWDLSEGKIVTSITQHKEKVSRLLLCTVYRFIRAYCSSGDGRHCGELTNLVLLF